MYILKKGSLEDYLPMGYKTKGLDPLVDFVTSQGFWDKLESDAQSELIEIIGSVVAIRSPEENPGCASEITAECSLTYGQHSYVPEPPNRRIREDAKVFR